MNSSCQTSGFLKAGIFWLGMALGRGEGCPVRVAFGAGPQRILTHVHVFATYAKNFNMFDDCSPFSLLPFVKTTKSVLGNAE